MRSAHSFDQIRRRKALSERDTNHRTTPSFHNIAPNDVVRTPVGAFDQDIGLHGGNQGARRVLVEHGDSINAAQRRDEFGTLAFRRNRASPSFVGPHRPIGVDPDDQRVTERTCIAQISNMTRMKQIEHTVGKHDTATVRADAPRER